MISVIYLVLLVIVAAGSWKTFEKAGQPGWAALVPIYNFYIMAKISGTKNWWLIFIPIANIYIAFVTLVALAKSFGKDMSFGIGLFFLGFVFFPMLGFGDAVYSGPNGENVFQAQLDAIGK